MAEIRVKIDKYFNIPGEIFANNIIGSVNYYGKARQRAACGVEDAKYEEVKESGRAAVQTTDQHIAAAIRQLCDEGILKRKVHWYAVYRVLSECFNYPKDRSDFCRCVEALPLEGITVPCEYGKWRKFDEDKAYLRTLAVGKWHQRRSNMTAPVAEQEKCAYRLMQLLDIAEAVP